jgi:cell wall assembly regulator SMI1
MSLDEVSAFWERFDEVVASHAPDLFAQMAPPAAEHDILAVEKSLGMPLPPILRRSYRHHDGAGQAYIVPGLFGTWCQVAELAGLYAGSPTQSVRVKRHPGTQALIDEDWIQRHPLQPWPHHPKRLPFIRTMDDEIVAADLFPGGTGCLEQLVHITHSPSIGLLAKNWMAMLAPLVDGLVDGSIYWGTETESSGTVSWHYTRTQQPVSAWAFYLQACWLGYLE